MKIVPNLHNLKLSTATSSFQISRKDIKDFDNKLTAWVLHFKEAFYMSLDIISIFNYYILVLVTFQLFLLLRIQIFWVLGAQPLVLNKVSGIFCSLFCSLYIVPLATTPLNTSMSTWGWGELRLRIFSTGGDFIWGGGGTLLQSIK